MEKQVSARLGARLVLAVSTAAACAGPPASESSDSPFGTRSLDEAVVFAPGTISHREVEEFGITFLPDGRTAFFTSQRPGDEFFTIYVSRFEDGEWSAPEVAPFSGEHFDADAFVSPDGTKLFYFSMRPVAGTTPLEIPDTWVVERDGAAWSEPRNLGPPVNLPESGEAFVTATHDGTLYFSSVNRPGASGLHDVYRARPVAGGYAEPEHLDIALEVQFSNPLIAPDESWLIVDSKQEGGYGGGDLYVSHRRNDGWTSPRNLGPLVNTSRDEGTPALSPDGRFLFFSRDGDIYYLSVGAIEVLR